MNLQDALALFTFALAIAGVVFALGKQAEILSTNKSDLERTDRRLDDLSKFIVRVDQRVADLERHVYGERSWVHFRNEEDAEFS